MKLSGEDADSLIREWVKEEFKKGAGLVYDLGKFFFTVSSSTLGLRVAIEKLGSGANMGWQGTLSLSMLFLSILVALRMAIPRIYDLASTRDLYDVYAAHNNRLTRLALSWFLLWIVGVALWLWEIWA